MTHYTINHYKLSYKLTTIPNSLVTPIPLPEAIKMVNFPDCIQPRGRRDADQTSDTFYDNDADFIDNSV